MPMSPEFEKRLYPVIEKITAHFGTPFHIYDEAGIRRTGEALVQAFSGLDGFREYFAVKALPNPRILEIMRDMGFGFDCSSIAELQAEPPDRRARRGDHVHLQQHRAGRTSWRRPARRRLHPQPGRHQPGAQGAGVSGADLLPLQPRARAAPETPSSATRSRRNTALPTTRRPRPTGAPSTAGRAGSASTPWWSQTSAITASWSRPWRCSSS
jgi:hypothetical protein